MTEQNLAQVDETDNSSESDVEAPTKNKSGKKEKTKTDSPKGAKNQAGVADMIKELTNKKRNTLTFTQLWLLAKTQPQFQDGHLMESQISQLIADATNKLQCEQDMTREGMLKAIRNQTSLEQKLNTTIISLSEIGRLETALKEAIEEQGFARIKLEDHELRIHDCSDKIGNMTLENMKRFDEQKKAHNKLSQFVYQPNHFLERLKESCDGVEKRLNSRIFKMETNMNMQLLLKKQEMTQVYEWKDQLSIAYQDNKTALEKLKAEHEVQKDKFVKYEHVLREFHTNIEQLKLHSLSTDLHLETSLPLQMASLAFDCVNPIVMKKQFPKFRKAFKARIEGLERNLQQCCDPEVTDYESIFRKNYYELPRDYLKPKSDKDDDDSKSKSKEKTKFKTESKNLYGVTLNELQLLNAKDKEKTKQNKAKKKAERITKKKLDIDPEKMLEMQLAGIPIPQEEKEVSSEESEEFMYNIPKSTSSQLFKCLNLNHLQGTNTALTLKELYHIISLQTNDFLKKHMVSIQQEGLGPYSMNDTANMDKSGLNRGKSASEQGEPPQPTQRPSGKQEIPIEGFNQPRYVGKGTNQTNAQWKLEKQMQLEAFNEKKKLQDHFTTAFEEVSTKIDEEVEQTEKRFKKQAEDQEKTSKALEILTEEYKLEKKLQDTRHIQKSKEIRQIDIDIESQRKRLKTLVGELEESITEQIKIPQIQILQTEYLRLREKEEKVVATMIERKNARAKSGGGTSMFKKDEVGIEIRKKVNKLRVKLKTITKKLAKYGKVGKIPMGATSRIYYENSDDDDSSASSDSESGSQASDDSSPKKKIKKGKQPKGPVLETGMVYQPVYDRVVKSSELNLDRFKNIPEPMMKKVEEQEEANESSPKKIKEKTQRREKLEDFTKIAVKSMKSILNPDLNNDSGSDSSVSKVTTKNDIEKSQFAKQHILKKSVEGLLGSSRVPGPVGGFRSSKTLTNVMQSIEYSNENKLNENESEVQFDDDESKRLDRKSFKSEQSIAKLVAFGSNKMSNQLSKARKAAKKPKMVDVEAQTDEVVVGEVLVNLEDLAKDNALSETLEPLKKETSEAGTDAPQFIILNIIEGRLEPPTPKPVEPQKNILGGALQRVKDEDKRKNIQRQGTAGEMMTNYSLSNGKTGSGVMELLKKSSENSQVYTAFNNIKQNSFLEQRLEIAIQKKLSLVNELDGIVSGSRNFEQGESNSKLIVKPTIKLSNKSITKEIERTPNTSNLKISNFNQTSNVKFQIDAESKTSTFVKNGRESPNFKKSPIRQGHVFNGKDEFQEAREKFDNFDKLSKKKSVVSRGRKKLKNSENRSATSRRTIQKSKKSAEKEKEKVVPTKLGAQLEEGKSDGSGSLSSEYGDESDDYVGVDAFKEFKDKMNDEKRDQNYRIQKLREVIENSLDENVKLIAKVEQVDWNVIQQAEDKTARTLQEFQQTVEALYLQIKQDLKMWRQQSTNLEAKNENNTKQTQNLYYLIKCLKEQVFHTEESENNILNNLIKFASIQSNLMASDEQDKKSIALIGVRDRETYTAAPASGIDHGYQTAQAFSPKKGPALELDPNCQACKCSSASERAALLQSFKMACLSYRPSPVTVEQGITLMRPEVIDVQQEIADHLTTSQESRQHRQFQMRQRFEDIEVQISKRNLDVPILDYAQNPRFLQDDSALVFKSMMSNNPIDIQINSQHSSMPLNLIHVDEESAFEDGFQVNSFKLDKAFEKRKSTLEMTPIEEKAFISQLNSSETSIAPRRTIPMNKIKNMEKQSSTASKPPKQNFFFTRNTDPLTSEQDGSRTVNQQRQNLQRRFKLNLPEIDDNGNKKTSPERQVGSVSSRDHQKKEILDHNSTHIPNSARFSMKSERQDNSSVRNSSIANAISIPSTIKKPGTASGRRNYKSIPAKNARQSHNEISKKHGTLMQDNQALETIVSSQNVSQPTIGRKASKTQQKTAAIIQTPRNLTERASRGLIIESIHTMGEPKSSGDDDFLQPQLLPMQIEVTSSPTLPKETRNLQINKLSSTEVGVTTSRRTNPNNKVSDQEIRQLQRNITRGMTTTKKENSQSSPNVSRHR